MARRRGRMHIIRLRPVHGGPSGPGGWTEWTVEIDGRVEGERFNSKAQAVSYARWRAKQFLRARVEGANEGRRRRRRRNPSGGGYSLKTLGWTLLVAGLTAGVGAVVIYYVNKELTASEPKTPEPALDVSISGQWADWAKKTFPPFDKVA